MAKGKKTGGRNWKPGQSGNPNGSPGLPQDLKHARTLKRLDFERVLNRFLYSTDLERAETISHPDAPAIDKLVATIMSLAIEEGDHHRLDFILNRLIGKVKDQVEVTSKPFIITRPSGEEIVMGTEEKHDETL